jgi:hypothetical protein
LTYINGTAIQLEATDDDVMVEYKTVRFRFERPVDPEINTFFQGPML